MSYYMTVEKAVDTCTKDTSAHDSARCRMWARLIGEDYFDMNKNQKKKARLRYCEENGYMIPSEVNCFDCCDQAKAVAPIPAGTTLTFSKLQKLKQEVMDSIMYPPVVEWNTTKVAKKGNNMYTTQTYTNEPDARDHLRGRMYQVRDEKNKDLQKFFGLIDDMPPSTAEDFVQRIKDGNYVLREKSECRESFRDRVRWRSPDKVEDRDGYQKANDLLAKDMQDVDDIITVLDVKAGFDALKQFVSKTYH